MNSNTNTEYFNEYLVLYNKVLSFISKFKSASDCFLNGCCYWFSNILRTRFMSYDDVVISVVYDQIEGHFLTKFYFPFIKITRLFDVRGDVTDTYDCENLKELHAIRREDNLLYNRLNRDCIKLET